MALRPCPECGHEVSTEATACPQCGFDFAAHKRKEDNTSAAGGWVVLLIVLAIGIYSCGGDGDSEPAKDSSPEHSPSAAYVMCQQFMKDRLRAPGTADFPYGTDRYTTSEGGGRYRVESYVDAENGFGGEVRTDYTCVVEYSGDDKWTLLKMETD